ncbi:MAG: TonB family protein [Balneolaceae bacterium]|nr:TonB family protein [Balneolaceae bacterium]
MVIRKKPDADLRNYHSIFLEIGLLLVLIIFIVLTRIDIRASSDREFVPMEREVVQMEEIIQTRQIETPPPPPRPPVPVAVPNDVIIDDINIQIYTEFDLGSPLQLPPRPVQEEEEPEEDFFVVVEQMPELIGGLSQLQRQVRYPEMARRAGIEGRVYVQFIVNERGEVEDPKVIRGIGGGADEEALRVVSQARFTPGMQRGRPVRVQYMLPIFFRLQN